MLLISGLPANNPPNINYADFFPGLPPYTPNEQAANQNMAPNHVTVPIANDNSGRITGPTNERPSSDIEGANQMRASQNQHNNVGTSV